MAMGVLTADVDQSDHQDDDWFEDGSDASELDREWKTREDEFHKMGYRDGVIAGKDASAQEGFALGYKQAVAVGHNWGLVRGFTSALACLPASLRAKVAGPEECRERFERLHETVIPISAADALSMFLKEMPLKRVENHHNGTKENCLTELSEDERAGGSSHLSFLLRELESIERGSSVLKFHWVEKGLLHGE